MTMISNNGGNIGSSSSVYSYSNQNNTLIGHTHNSGDIISLYNGQQIKLGEMVIELQDQIDSIIDFLKLKNIIINENEFQEFKESRKLMKEMED